jgi:hypothetical protein
MLTRVLRSSNRTSALAPRGRIRATDTTHRRAIAGGRLLAQRAATPQLVVAERVVSRTSESDIRRVESGSSGRTKRTG